MAQNTEPDLRELDPLLKDIQQARREKLRKGPLQTVGRVGRALEGKEQIPRGVSLHQGINYKLKVAELLAADDQIAASLEEQKMRYGYQVRTAEAQIAAAMYGVLQADMRASQERGSENAALQAQQAQTLFTVSHDQMGAHGFAHNEAHESRRIINMVQEYKAMPATGFSDAGIPMFDAPGNEGADAANAVASALLKDLPALMPLERAIFIDKLSQEVGLDVYGMFGIGEDAEGNIKTGGRMNKVGARLESYQAAPRMQMADWAVGAAKAQQIGETNDARFMEAIEKYREGVAQNSTYLSAMGENIWHALQPHLDNFGKDIPYGAEVTRSGSGEMIPVGEVPPPPADEAEGALPAGAAPPEAAPPEAGLFPGVEDELTTKSLLQSVLDTIDDPYPTKEIRRAKHFLFQDPAFIKGLQDLGISQSDRPTEQEKKVGFRYLMQDLRKREQESGAAARERVQELKDAEEPETPDTTEETQTKLRLEKRFRQKRARGRFTHFDEGEAVAEATPTPESEGGEPSPASTGTTGATDAGGGPGRSNEDPESDPEGKKRREEEEGRVVV